MRNPNSFSGLCWANKTGIYSQIQGMENVRKG